MKDKNNILRIQKTSNTLYDLRDHTDIKFCKEISDFLIGKSEGQERERLSDENFGAFPVSRYLTSHSVLELFAKKYGEDLQIIELGSGFTPHFLNLNYDIGKYIEIDHEENSKLKANITKKLTDKNNVSFLSGDILHREVWAGIKNIIDLNKPVVVFSEGVVAQYFDFEQKEKIGSYVKDIMLTNGSAFIIDDTLRNHSELHSNNLIEDGVRRITSLSGSVEYKKSSNFLKELDNWRNVFNNRIYTVDYVLSKPNMDFAIEELKLTICMNDEKGEFQSMLLELSEKNKNSRVWK